MTQIAVIDDEKDLLSLMGDIFGCHVDTYSNFMELINNHKKYKVILMDKRMPRMDGEDLGKILRTLGYKDNLIIMSGDLDLQKPDHFDDIFNKPFSPSDMEKIKFLALCFGSKK